MATVSTDHPNATLFRRGYDAFNSGNMDTLRELFDQNVVWHVGGRDRFSGDKRGLDNTLAFFPELVQVSGGTFRLDVHDIVANDDHAIALVTSHIEVDGKPYDDIGAHAVHIRGGKVTESWFFAWNPYQFDELFPA